jgi:uridine kinase
MNNKLISITEINAAISGSPAAFVNEADGRYKAHIEAVSAQIGQIPLVLIAGPSGSAKTTTAARLAETLINMGTPAFTLSMDNYFHPKWHEVDCPKNADGTLDFESPLRVDVPLFHEHIQRIAAGETVQLPHFDFVSQLRTDGETIKRPPHGVVIIEGLHALNPMMTEGLAHLTFPVYVSVETGVIYDNADSPGVLTPAVIRLLRRLCRDRKHRGRTIDEIWGMYESVCLGEERYIKPFRGRAKADINTFLPYELSVYKNILEKDLTACEERFAANPDFCAIREVMKKIEPLSTDFINKGSIINEFIGGA